MLQWVTKQKTGAPILKILLSAIACNPVTGSDAYFGWSAVQALSSLGQVHVLTHGFSRGYITPDDEARLPGVTFHFIGEAAALSKNGLLARIQSWEGCRTWQAQLLLPHARALHAKEGFDLAHHVTISSWRLPSPLWQLGIPLIWGPLGGGEEVPGKFRHLLSPSTRAFELFRHITSRVSRMSPSLKQCAKHSKIALAANSETSDALGGLGCHRIELLSPAFFSDERIERLREGLTEKNWAGPLRIFSGGNLEGRKGVAISLRALARLKGEGIRFQYRLGGGGAEGSFLRNLAADLGLSGDDVVFGDALSGRTYTDELHASHIYLLPSLRENAGLTMMEAMLAGCVPVVLKLGGPGEIVTPECGFAVEALNPEKVIEGIVACLRELDCNRARAKELGGASSNRVSLHYSQASYLGTIQQLYRELLA